jgi:hypothetical protein
MRWFTIVSFTAFFCLAVFPLNILALPIWGAGEYGDSFSGSIEYIPGVGSTSTIDAAGGSLIVNLTNTSERREFTIAGLSLAGPYLYSRSEVTLGAGQMARFYFSVTDPGFFRLTEENFLAEGSEVIVHFYLGDAYGQTWDRVRVSAVPEPEMMVLLGIGLLALGIVMRRRSM